LVIAALLRLWRGDLPLPDAIVTWGVLVALPINVVTTVAFWWLISIDRPIAALLIGNIPAVPFNIFCGVGIWRAATQVESPTLRGLVRAATVLAAIALSVT
jgi:hypothetical protein